MSRLFFDSGRQHRRAVQTRTMTMSTRHDFRQRMRRDASELVVAPLALDALSAALAKRTGFDAVYLGGGGLGYARAVSEALLTASEVAEATRAIRERVDLAVVVDGGVGFGDAVHMARSIRMIEQAGAAAIEIEDQVVPKRAHHHKGVEHLVSTEEMAGKIAAAADARQSSDFVLIVRCNAIRHEGLDRALERAAAYVAAGADMLMLLPRSDEEFEAVSRGTTVPLAAMAIGASRPAAAMCAAGYPLQVEPMSATVLGFRALQAGYQGLKAGTGIGMSREEIMATIAEVGETIGMQALYDIEARTTERPAGAPASV
jgi:2-methylisocitrate lyase-like PEP mutase family enzyme